jgi:predicted ATPase
MKDYPEISLGVHHNDEGEPLVYVDGVLCGTVENLKRSVDRYWDEEIHRKLAEAGVQFSMTDGVPKVSVPASAAHMVDVEGYYPKNEVDAVYSAVTDSLKLASEIQDLRRRQSL